MTTTASAPSLAADDYLSQPVPERGRKPGLSVLVVFVGFIIVAGQMVVGGSLAGQLSLGSLVFAVLAGNAIAGVFAAAAGYTGTRSGKTFNQMLIDAFPGWSWRAASLYVPIVLIGWYAIETSIFGSLVAAAFDASAAVTRLVIFGSGLGFAVSAYFGFRGLRIVSFVAVPLLLVIGVYAIQLAATSADAEFGFSESRITTNAAVALVVGSWIMGALTCVPDMTRFSRTLLGGAAVGFVGIFLGNSFNHLVGAAGAALAKESDPALILIGLGLIVPAILFAVANIWTTNDSNMYSASLHVAPLFGLKRRNAVLLCTILGAAIAITKPHEIGKLFMFLGFLNTTAPSLGAIVLARYWWSEWGIARTAKSSLPAWVSWIGGSVLAFLAGPEWAYLVGFVAALALYYGPTLVTGRSSEAPTNVS